MSEIPCKAELDEYHAAMEERDLWAERSTIPSSNEPIPKTGDIVPIIITPEMDAMLSNAKRELERAEARLQAASEALRRCEELAKQQPRAE